MKINWMDNVVICNGVIVSMMSHEGGKRRVSFLVILIRVHLSLQSRTKSPKKRSLINNYPYK